ncbi:MAG: peptidoglycan DD-metalloendopeptidase family protein [Pseudomonadota bacterium]
MNIVTRVSIVWLAVLLLAACGSYGPAPVEDRLRDSGVKVYQVQSGDTLYSIAFRYGLDYRQVAQVNSISSPYLIYPGQHLYLWETPGNPIDVTPQKSAATIHSGSPGLPVDYAPSAVVVTAVPGVATTPISQAGRPPSPVYQAGAQPGAQQDRSTTNQVATVSEQPPVEKKPAAEADTVAAIVRPAPVTPTNTAIKPSRTPTPGARVRAWRWPSQGSVTRRYSAGVHKGIDIGGVRGDPIYAVADGTVVYAGTGIVGFGELLIVKHNETYLSAYGHNSRLLVSEGDIVGAGQTIAEKGSTGTDTVKLHFEIRKEGKPVDPLKLLPGR